MGKCWGGSCFTAFEVSTVGQPFENLKTLMAANRNDNLTQAVRRLYARGGARAFWHGLIPWAWIEASTKGGVLLFVQSEITNYGIRTFGLSAGSAGAIGGIGGGICQAYTTMGFCTFMKTVEMTRSKVGNAAEQSSVAIAREIFRREGIKGMYKGVNAVAMRQATNWGSRFGFSRLVESVFRGNDKSKTLSKAERLASSAIGGGLACWNQPLEVIRVEMQSQKKGKDSDSHRRSILSTARSIYRENGLRGFYRGVTPRIGLSVYLTTVMVYGGDEVKRVLFK